MRVGILAAGAAGMICGSCLRDNRLAATLRRMGRDVTLIPLYTPIRTDEHDVSSDAVYFGGVNVYLQQKSALFRWLPSALDRVLDTPWLLRRLAGSAAKVRPQEVAALTVSMLRGRDGNKRKEVQRLIQGLAALRFDVIVLPNLLFLGIARQLREALGAVVLCTLSGEDIFVDQLPEPQRAQALALIRQQAAHADGFVAVSHYFARHAASHFGLPAERVHVVPLGIATEDFTAPGALPPGGPLQVGYLARICPEKGLANLLEALIVLRDAGHDVTVRAAGYVGAADQEYLSSLHARAHARGVADRFEVLGEVSREQKLALLRDVHVLAVPTEYPEAKGLFVLEALAAGVPVVLPEHGSFPELVNATGGGLLHRPCDVGDLARALLDLKQDPALRARLAQAGRAVVQREFTDVIMAERAWRLFERFAAAAQPGGGAAKIA